MQEDRFEFLKLGNILMWFYVIPIYYNDDYGRLWLYFFVLAQLSISYFK